jgi:hypothetical protein
MAQLKCLCSRWNDVGGDVRYCTACSKSLDVDDFAELIGLDEKAADEYVAAQRGGVDVAGCFVIAYGMAIASGAIVEQLGRRWAPIVTCFVFLFGFGGLATLQRRSRRRRMQYVVTKYQHLWSMPATFRPSIPKS